MAIGHHLSTSSTLASIPALTTLYGSLFLLPYLSFHEVDCFNINTKRAKIIEGPKDSNFGYSLRLKTPDRPASKPHSLYIGAPKYSNHSGLVYKCDIGIRDLSQCTEIQGNTSLQVVQGGRFGSSIALFLDGLLICIPAWRPDDRYISFSITPGSCYRFMDCKNSSQDHCYRCTEWNSNHCHPIYKGAINPYMDKNYKKIIAVVNKKRIINYGLAQFGMSADSNKRNWIAVGAPGLFNFEGGIYLRDLSNSAEVKTEPELVDNLKTKADRYMGYSIKFGRFCDTPGPCVIVGAPLENNVGAVRIISWANKMKKELKEIQKLDGDSLWSYFGSSIAPVDLNKDEYDEILVGAPYYTDLREEVARNPDRLDQGRVFVYTRQKEKYVLTQTLVGSNTRFSRFGISLQALGDINMDQNTDIAVGAPWEEDGCIYIFMGDGGGVKTPYAQRITAKQLPTLPNSKPPAIITGLGFQLAALPLSNKSEVPVPVLVATSVTSDAVALFYTRPIVFVTIRLTPSTKFIDPSSSCSQINSIDPCFHFNLTISYEIKANVQDISNITFKLRVGVDVDAPTKDSRRATIQQSEGVDDTNWTTINVFGSDERSYLVVISKTQERLISPIKIRAEYELVDNQTQDPILDYFTDTFVEEEVRFFHQCGLDDYCTVDLKTNGSLTFTTVHSYSAYDSLVINATSEMIVTIEVTNEGEPSYRTDLSIAVDLDTPYLHGPPNCQPQENKALVKCLHNLLQTGGKFTIGLAFDTSEMSLNSKLVTVNVTAMPGDLDVSNDTDLSDNTIILTADVSLIADVTLEGSSSPSELTFVQAKRFSEASKVKIDKTYLDQTVDDTKQKLNITHKALVKSMGPSFLPATDIFVAVPWFALDGTQLVKKADVQLSLSDGPLQVNCSPAFDFDGHLNFLRTPSFIEASSGLRVNERISEQHLTRTATTSTTTRTTTTTSKPPETTSPTSALSTFRPVVNNRRKRRSAGTDVDTFAHVMNCEINPEFCKYYTCTLPSAMEAGDYAFITAHFKIDKTGLPIPKGFTSLHFTTTIQVKQPKHLLLRPWNMVPKITLLTKLHLREDGTLFKIWIIVSSVAGGLVLITILVLILWKCGFFKRDKHYQVEIRKRQSYRQSMRVASPNTEKCD